MVEQNFMHHNVRLHLVLGVKTFSSNKLISVKCLRISVRDYTKKPQTFFYNPLYLWC